MNLSGITISIRRAAAGHTRRKKHLHLAMEGESTQGTVAPN